MDHSATIINNAICRPVQIAFEKETKESTKAKEAWIKSQIDELQDFIFEGSRLSFELILTMIDGKVKIHNIFDI